MNNFPRTMTRPVPLTVNLSGIPAALKAEPRWLNWKYSWSPHEAKGRWIKRPRGKTNKPSTWNTFDAAVAQLATYDGVGFVLGDGWAGLDLDHCRPGHLADAVIRRIQCYVEVSPSDTGYKAIGRSYRMGGQIDFSQTPPSFTSWHGPRYFTVTGRSAGVHGTNVTWNLDKLIEEYFPETQSKFAHGPVPDYIQIGDVRGTENIELLTDKQVLERAATAQNRNKFLQLFRGDISEYGNDHSRADQALVCILFYYCQGDTNQVDRLFRLSKLMRPKWETRSYRLATLSKGSQLV